MKKNLFIVVFSFLFLAANGLSAQTSSVVVTTISANYSATPPTVTFKVSWPNNRTADFRSKVWVLVDYRRILNNAIAGDWLRAGITVPASSITTTAGTVSIESGNDKGFWLQGTDGAFAATVTVPVTVDLNGYASQFGWCGVALDRPPTALPIAGGYTLQGTPPFIIQTDPLNPGSAVSHSNTVYNNCIYGLTDSTGCPGEWPPMPAITGFNASAASICAGQSVTLTAAATNAERYSFDDGATWVSSASTVVSPAVTTTYILKASRTNGACTVTWPTSITITVHPLPDVEFVGPPASLWSNSETVLTVNDKNNVASSYCFTYECTACVQNPYLTGSEEPAAAACHWYSECVYGTAKNFTVHAYDAGTITLRAKAKSAAGCESSTSDLTLPIVASPSPPPNAGIYTWSCGTQTWSGALRNPAGCSGTSSLSTSTTTPPAQYRDYSSSDGYYYNWTCVNNNASTLCPTPWHVPTQSDFTTLVSCAGGDAAAGATLSSAWGLPGLASGSAMNNVGETGRFWSATEDNSSNLAYFLYYNPPVVEVARAYRYNAHQVRCVQDTP